MFQVHFKDSSIDENIEDLLHLSATDQVQNSE